MKRGLKVLSIFLMTLFIMPFVVDAASITYEDIPNGSYIIGTHIFTRESGSLTVKKIMLASQTIESDSLDDMQIIYKDIMGNLKEVSNGKDKDTNQYPDAEIELTDTLIYEYYDLEVDLVTKLSKKGKNLITNNYNSVENVTYGLSDDEFPIDDFYVKVGKYSGSAVNKITINGTEYTNEYKRMGIGQNSWLEAPIWKVEDKTLYVATAWLIAESMPEALTEVKIGSTTYNVKVFNDSVTENTLTISNVYALNKVEGETFNIAREGSNIAVESSDGRHIVGVTLSLNGEDLTDSNDIIYSLAENGTLSLTTPEAIEKEYGDRTDLQTVTYGIYPAYKDGKYTEQEEKTVLHKIAIPGKGVIRLNFSLTPINFVKTIYTDGVVASTPNLGELVPIKHNGETWEYADTYEEWYNYADSEWANAVVLADGVEKEVGDSIDEDEIDLWFVWVPRYEYKLPADSIGTTGTPKAIDINFISSSATTPSEGYSFHPGFAWDEDWSDGISEWKDGIWIGKFESTANVTGGENANVLQNVKIKADTTPWRNVQISNMYTSALDIDSTYSLSGMDSHMTRYTEWSAISYLSNSIYGLCTDATTCTEIALNILDEYVDSEDYEDDNSYLTGGGDYKTNVAQSTTGNIYGIYDMNGGAAEYVMGYLDEAENLYTHSGFTDSTITTSHKYSDIFESSDNTDYTYASLSNVNGTTSMNGIFKELMTEDTYEGCTTWYGDAADSVGSGIPWFGVGAYWVIGSISGAFASSYNYGIASPGFGFRVVLS